MNRRSKHLWLEFKKGARKLSNIFWAFTVSLGSSGFFFLGIYSCISQFWGISSSIGQYLISFVPFKQIPFFPQGIVVFFYGIAGFAISLYLWCTVFWNVGSGYDRFDRKEGIACIFRWGFPGKNRRIVLRFRITDIQSVRIVVKEGPYDCRALYMDIRGRGVLLVTHPDENLTPQEIEQKATKLAFFLRVPIE